MTLAVLERAAVAGDEGAARKRRYLEIRARLGGPAGPEALAFVTPAGGPLDPAVFDGYLRALASVRSAMEFNGALCRGLLEARERAARPSKPELSAGPGAERSS